jgi:Fe-S cluster assembly protein SufD
MKDIIKQQIIEEFLNFENKINGQKQSKIHNVREKAFEVLKKLDLPSRKNELWRFTNADFLDDFSFNLEYNKSDENLSHKDIEPFRIKDLKDNLLVFVNGIYSEKLSKIMFPRDEIIVESIASAEMRNSPNLNNNFSKIADYNNDFFTALNTAFAKDGLYVNVPAGVYIEEPLHILYINDARNKPIISNPRNLFLMSKCSRLCVIETYHTIGDFPSFTNMVTEVAMNFLSNFEFSKVQNDVGKTHYIGTMAVNQGKNSELKSSVFTLGGKFVRNNQNIKLTGENADTNLYGFYFMKNNDFVGNYVIVDHDVPNCNSNQFFKGIMDNDSRAVFNAKIIVRPDAQKTNAYQSNKNILLTDEAKVNTMPQLEIYADDVKCSHGATTGHLDNNALYYMRTRGIGEKMAKSLLLNAFASDIIEKIIINELRDEVKNNVAERLVPNDIYFCDVLDDMYIKNK